MPEPKATRPYWPDALHDLPKSDEGLKHWSWARERLEKSHNYWIATTRPDGPPHLMIVWGVWWQDSFWFSTGSRTRKARNLAAHPRCSVGTEAADQAVILEGNVEQVSDRDTWKKMCSIYDQKYGGDTLALLESTASLVFRVQPATVFALDEHAENFATALTRWKF